MKSNRKACNLTPVTACRSSYESKAANRIRARTTPTPAGCTSPHAHSSGVALQHSCVTGPAARGDTVGQPWRGIYRHSSAIMLPWAKTKIVLAVFDAQMRCIVAAQCRSGDAKSKGPKVSLRCTVAPPGDVSELSVICHDTYFLGR